MAAHLELISSMCCAGCLIENTNLAWAALPLTQLMSPRCKPNFKGKKHVTMHWTDMLGVRLAACKVAHPTVNSTGSAAGPSAAVLAHMQPLSTSTLRCSPCLLMQITDLCGAAGRGR